MNKRKLSVIGMQCVNYRVRRVTRLVGQLYDQALADQDLRITQFSILTAVAYYGPLGLVALAAELGLDRTTLTKNLNPLIRRGLIRKQSGEDARSRLISVTDKGMAVIDRAYPAWNETQKKISQAFGRHRLHHLLAELQSLELGLKPAAADG